MRAALERYGLRHRVDRRRRLVDDGDAVLLRQRLVAMGERIERAQAGEIEIAEEAGGVALLRLDQRHVDGALLGADIWRPSRRRCRRRSPRPAPWPGRAPGGPSAASSAAPARAPNSRRVQDFMAGSLLLRGEIARDARELLVAERERDGMHDMVWRSRSPVGEHGVDDLFSSRPAMAGIPLSLPSGHGRPRRSRRAEHPVSSAARADGSATPAAIEGPRAGSETRPRDSCAASPSQLTVSWCDSE